MKKTEKIILEINIIDIFSKYFIYNNSINI